VKPIGCIRLFNDFPIMLAVLLLNNLHENTVMGIKGRRVHMIEELSQTIISFQRGKKQMNDPPMACHSILCSCIARTVLIERGSLVPQKHLSNPLSHH